MATQRAASSTPLPSTSTPVPSTSKAPAAAAAAPKPINVFSNDGSFLDRFKKKGTEDEEEKKRQKDAFDRAQALQDRFKKRARRPPTDAGSESKKRKTDADEEGLTAYEKEVRKLSRGQGLRDEGIGIRPLNK